MIITSSRILDIKYGTREYLSVSWIWLADNHSNKVDLLTNVKLLYIYKKVMAASIDALCYNILTEIISRYEQLLTSVELTISDFGQQSLQKRATKKILEQLDAKTFLASKGDYELSTPTENDKDEINYLRIAYDDTYQLIDLVESFRDTINSTRDLYIANFSMQMNDTMRTLTIFTAILLPLTLITGICGMNGLDLTDIGNIPIGFTIVVITMIVMAAFTLLGFQGYLIRDLGILIGGSI